MPDLDRSIILFLNGFAHRSVALDVLVVELTRSQTFGAGGVMAIFWWAWFRHERNDERYRPILLSTLLGAFVAIVLGRVLALLLPFRLRPLHDPALHFVLPYGMNADVLRGWSSFPSDHAMIFFEFAVGVLLVHRRLGWLLLVHALFVISLARVYTGQHYPSDILGGAAIGVLMALSFTSRRVRGVIARPILRIEERSPSAFYAILFLISLEVADMFQEPRTMLNLLFTHHHHGL